ncbi:IS66 family insertion sequence element accessory protein TnpB [Photobacterium leiognathi]|uniref:IS66 family insertion sequence element accessory protein TnpB n=1 Tax=Photobacterium leiognathi TaxID=553611 RepID=UPI0027389B78|nr:IS66 family insertion sequence element accessory protein TnpB [Photobacterium leiognathi]
MEFQTLTISPCGFMGRILSTRAFCKLNELNPSTFYAKRLQLKKASFSQSFVRAEVVEKTTKYQAQIAAANMTLLVNDVELSIPQGTPAPYIAELIGALS